MMIPASKVGLIIGEQCVKTLCCWKMRLNSDLNMYNENSFLTTIADYSWRNSVNIYHLRSDDKMIVCMVTYLVLFCA